MNYLPFTRPTIDEATISGVADVLRSGWITSGPQVKAFETRLSAYFGGRPVRSVNSGTGTLELALAVAGVGSGDEVITTPLSWVATANVVLRAGARPVFIDIDPATRNIDLSLVKAAVTVKTKAIIPVIPMIRMIRITNSQILLGRQNSKRYAFPILRIY